MRISWGLKTYMFEKSSAYCRVSISCRVPKPVFFPRCYEIFAYATKDSWRRLPGISCFPAGQTQRGRFRSSLSMWQPSVVWAMPDSLWGLFWAPASLAVITCLVSLLTSVLGLPCFPGAQPTLRLTGAYTWALVHLARAVRLLVSGCRWGRQSPAGWLLKPWLTL